MTTHTPSSDRLAAAEPVVMQADREAAAALYLDLEGPPHSPHDLAESARHKTGEYDAHPAVLAFATHRQAAVAAERARIVAWLRDDNVWGLLINWSRHSFADAIEGIDALARVREG